MALPHIGPRLAVGLVVLAIVATEVGLRASGTVGHELRSNPSARYGYTLIPGQELLSEQAVSLSINSLGFRDREWTDEDLASVRIAVFGDSVAFGRDVPPEGVWCRRLETSLRARESSGRRIVVQNYAVPGYLLEQYERVFDDLVAPTRPAVVVLTVAPYSVWPMQVRTDSSFVPLRRWLLGTAIFESIDKIRREMRDEGVVLVRRDAHGVWGADPLAPEYDANWDAAFARLERMQAAVESWGGRLVLVSIPLLEWMFERPPPSRFEAWARGRPSVVWVDPDPALIESMQPLAREMNERHLSIDDVWKRGPLDPPYTPFVHGDTAVFFLHDRYHMSPRGHAVTATVVEAALVEAGLP